ncbi:ATP-dependent endonuclease [Aquipseudomonas alcaligenes]|uniref:ATP-dependent endonuclease n=1 Tax=Aquipseudomonas alcaligenes TaxID=43263 RepID=A0A2V4LUA3_AQUAC|nr:AAA family ATPase [Pseudomonas alcaligenes]PYC29603.1 ATP-dependent endonuclease [Pseudomonas alcaligenes]
MHLQRIRAANFRAFGDGTQSPALDWELSPGLNILVGENDSGKTSVIDAIRYVLWTTSYEFIRLFESDFHITGAGRARSLFIEATLVDLDPAQEASVLEWLTHEENGSRSLIIHLQARWVPPKGNKRGRVEAVTCAGRNGTGQEIGTAVRELIRATYLRPLRDAEAELRPGRQSRLSQILAAHRSIDGQEQNDFDITTPATVPSNLVGLMAFAQHHLGNHQVIRDVQDDINNNYLNKFGFAGDALSSRIQITPDLGLQPILERFELGLLPASGIDPNERCVRGLGYNNALFMATELVLLRDGDELALLLIEEPEAHLHPQLQERVQQLLERTSKAADEGSRPVQIVMTTHSPSLAAGADIASMTLVNRAQLFSLAHGKTKLNKSDYDFLRRFIDATKANLFFARGVVIVEGAAEALLLPALAAAAGCSFNEHGISCVNVGSVGLYHYARILQPSDGSAIPIPVVCITDRDVVPDEATYISRPQNGRKRFISDYSAEELTTVVQSKQDRAQGGSTIVCVSDDWTLEFDLAKYGCAELMHNAIHLAMKAGSRGERLTEEDEKTAIAEAKALWADLAAADHSDVNLASIIYQPLAEGDASKAIAAQYAAHLVLTGEYGVGDELYRRLPPYLQRAFNHLTGKVVE